MVRAGGILAVTTALSVTIAPSSHMQYEEVAISALEALTGLAYPLQPDFTLAVVACVPLVIQVMERHHTAPIVQSLGCAFIGCIFKSHSGHINSSPMYTHAVEVLLTCLSNWPTDFRVQANGMDAMAMICGVEGGARIVVESPSHNGIHLVVASMTYHINNKSIQRGGCRALSSISACSAYHPLLVDAGAIRVVLRAMESCYIHPNHYETVQEHGSLTLAHIGDSDKTLQKLIKDQGAEKVLRNAFEGRATTDECDVRARALLLKLEAV